MASKLDFVQYVCDQISDAGKIEYRKMFGDYCLYCDGIVIGLICDNQFFLKETKEARTIMKEIVEAPAYKGAKDSFLIESLGDKEYLTRLVETTCSALKNQSRSK